MLVRIAPLICALLIGFTAARADTISLREVQRAIAILEKSVLSEEATEAAAIVTRFADESDAVLITLGPETLPWVQPSTGRDSSYRALLMAVYFAGNLKTQLAKGRPEDDPYSGWLAVIKAYQEIRRQQPRIQIAEIEELIAQEKAGKLRPIAEALRKKISPSRRDII